MTKASSIFDFSPWANWITKDKDGCVNIWRRKPEIFKREPSSLEWFWTTPQFVGNYKQLGFMEIDEFKDKDWKECIIERPKEIETFEELRDWADEHAEIDDIYEGRFNFSYDYEIFFIIQDNGEETGIYNGYGDFIFGAKPEKVKRVLESMLEE